MMTERKRRPEDGQDLDDVHSPPSLTKKRHTTKESDFQTLSAEFDENAAMLDLESIREFQKEAIWRQMQEYKRDAQRAADRTAAAEKRQAWWEERIAAVCAGWSRAICDLDAILNVDDPAASDRHSDLGAQEKWLDIMLPRSCPDERAPADGPAPVDAQSGLERFHTSVNSVLRQLQSRSSSSTAIDWAAAVDRLARSRGAVDNADDLQSQVALLSRHLSEAQEMLEQREHDLRRALKRLDRKLCPTVRGHERDEPRAGGDANNGSGATSPTAAAGTTDGSHAAAAAAAATEPPSVADTPSAGPAATNGCAAPEASAQKAQQALADYKLLAEQRLAEIEERMRENTELVMQVDSLRLQIASVPDYIISETALYKQVEAGRNHYGTQAQRLQAEVDRLLAEAGELRTTRGAFEEGVVAEASAQRTALETELQRLQNDLVRVRHHRDQMQRELEERRAQDAVEDQKSTELKLLSDVRRERMNALISENKRLLAYIAIQRGDRAAFETYTDEELSKATAVADELRAKLEQMTRRERHLSDKLGALSVRGDGDNDGNADGESGSLPPEQQQSPASDVARLLGELQDAQDKLARFQQRVQKYEEILGGALVDGQGSVVADAAAQGCELAAKQRRIDELVLERDGLAKTSEMMERELQTICESFAKLEEQNTSKVWDLGQKEQVIARVIAEKSKYEEKFIGLNKDREAQRLANQALRAQSAKQLEHIKAIEERDRALAQQLSLLESEAQHATQAWHASQTQLLETQRQTQALEEQARALEDKARAATAALGERTEALEAAEHARRRVEETLAAATAQRGAETDKPTDETGLAKLCADYKALLKCPTCQTNFKSHALLRCMHVFCKQCIDSRIETRQRKCPSCSEPFGAKDVRQIYL